MKTCSTTGMIFGFGGTANDKNLNHLNDGLQEGDVANGLLVPTDPGAIAGWLYARRKGYPVGESFDMFAPLTPVALIFIRTGCLMAGDSEGKLATVWPAMVQPDSQGVWASRYPTQWWS